MRKKTMYDILIQAVCIFCALLILFPILYAASVSFMEQKDVLSSPPNLLPPKPTLENYKTAFSSVTAMIFQLLFVPSLGFINGVFGLDIQWLNDPKLSLIHISEPTRPY